MAAVKTASIFQMRQWTRPDPPPGRRRAFPYETTVWSVDAVLTGYKLEEDSDYHLVLADSAGHTIIAEIPSPNCAIGSAFLAAIENARAEFDSQISADLGFTATSVPVHVSGVGFFDYLHGQHGVAPNGIELHPVFDIVFAPTGAPSFDLWIARDSVALGKTEPISQEIRTIAAGGFNGPVTLTVTQAPGFMASLSGPVIAAPGSGTSFVSITQVGEPPPGRHSFTLSATGGGVSRSVTFDVIVGGSRLPVERAGSQRSPRSVERD